eukprot:COSAG05_NODE_2426_length_3077_cov_4.195769_1_plen_48_part_00
MLQIYIKDEDTHGGEGHGHGDGDEPGAAERQKERLGSIAFIGLGYVL